MLTFTCMPSLTPNLKRVRAPLSFKVVVLIVWKTKLELARGDFRRAGKPILRLLNVCLADRWEFPKIADPNIVP